MEWLDRQAKNQAGRVALFYQGKSWTYSELNKAMLDLSNQLYHVLPKESKRVAIMSRNSNMMYIAILSLWHLKKEIVFLNTHLTQKELEYQLKDAQVSFVLCEEKFSSLLEDLPVNSLDLKSVSKMTIHSDTIAEVSIISGEDIASIMYTSGTTGKPKGVIQRFKNHYASAVATKDNMAITTEDNWLCAVPLFHISGLSILIRQLVLGSQVTLYNKFDAKKITQDLINAQGTVMSVVPTTLQSLMKELGDREYHPTFRSFLLGGAPASMMLLKTAQAKHVEVIQSFGMTETCSQVIALNNQDAAKHIGSVGKPLKHVELKLVTKSGEEAVANEPGELYLKGPSVVDGYLNDASFKDQYWSADGWFKTQDLALRDDSGYIYILSRLSDLIISGGENIYPKEIEDKCLLLNNVIDVAVVGQEDEVWGAVPVVYLVGDVNQAELEKHLKQHLASYKIPKAVYYCHSLPKTASGKIAKHRLLTKEREDFLC